MIDRDLAELYGVETKYLNRQVKRNIDRFPAEFMFQINEMEKRELVTNWHRLASMKHSSAQPYVFTEYGVVTLASVLNSEQAIKTSILITQTFVRLRELIRSNKEIESKINAIEKKITNHDEEIKLLIRRNQTFAKRKRQATREIRLHKIILRNSEKWQNQTTQKIISGR